MEHFWWLLLQERIFITKKYLVSLKKSQLLVLLLDHDED